MKHNFSIIREVLQDASDMETIEDNYKDCLTGRATPNQAFVALKNIEAHIVELEIELAKYSPYKDHLHRITGIDFKGTL